MIQRKQTIFLLLALASLIVCLCLPLGRIEPKGVSPFIYWYNLGFYEDGKCILRPWLFVDLVVIGTLTFIDIFLYKRRMLQAKICIANIILCLVWYGYYVFVALVANDILLRGTFHLCFAVCLPFVSMVFIFLAWRSIKADEELIRSMDRIR